MQERIRESFIFGVRIVQQTPNRLLANLSLSFNKRVLWVCRLPPAVYAGRRSLRGLGARAQW